MAEKATKNDSPVAIYNGPGAELASWVELHLNKCGLCYQKINAHDIQKGYLHRFRVLIMSGGYTTRYLPGLKQTGCKAINRFLYEQKGAYLGICAGAYIANSPELAVCESKMEREFGIFDCTIKIADPSHPIFQSLPSLSLTVHYQNGPHIHTHPNEVSLAFYPDNTASVIERVLHFPALIFSWHPEKLPLKISILSHSIQYLLSKSQ